MKAYETLEVVVSDYVCTIWLSRGHKRNAIDRQMARELMDCLAEMADDNRIRVVVLRGKGKVFCSGADLNWMQSPLQADDPDHPGLVLSALYQRCFVFPKPLIAMVHGYVMGGALGLMACADYVFASPATLLSFSEVRLGLIPATISPFVIARTGEFAARQLMLGGHLIQVSEALTLKLVDRIVPDNKAEITLREWCEQLTLNAPGAVKECKRLIRHVSDASMTRELFLFTSKQLSETIKGEEAREGMQAFLNKRKPRWQVKNE
jgi:methylglutaconyl-CoA hydratase